MRDSIIGVVLGALLIGGLFWLVQVDPPSTHLPTPADIADQVQPGFVGAKQVGPWILACPPGPHAAALTNPQAFGRCRVSLVYRRKDNPRQAVLLLTYRLIGPAQHLALIAVLPPVVKQGDELDLHSGTRMLKLPVSVCKDGRCVGIVVMSAAGEKELLSGNKGALVFPADQSGKRGAIGVPFAGMAPAIAAMRRANS
jgi:invasion protein IalB